MSNITDHLRSLRHARSLSLREVSAICGVPWQTLGHYERGKVDPPLSKLERWAAALDADLHVRMMLNVKQQAALTAVEGSISLLGDAEADALAVLASALGHKMSSR